MDAEAFLNFRNDVAILIIGGAGCVLGGHGQHDWFVRQRAHRRNGQQHHRCQRQR